MKGPEGGRHQELLKHLELFEAAFFFLQYAFYLVGFFAILQGVFAFVGHSPGAGVLYVAGGLTSFLLGYLWYAASLAGTGVIRVLVDIESNTRGGA